MRLPPPHSNYLDVFLRFIRTFIEVITFDEASAHEFQPNFKLSAFKIGHHFYRTNINYYINSLLRLRVGMCIIYIYIGRALHTGSQNENNIGAACGSP